MEYIAPMIGNPGDNSQGNLTPCIEEGKHKIDLELQGLKLMRLDLQNQRNTILSQTTGEQVRILRTVSHLEIWNSQNYQNWTDRLD